MESESHHRQFKGVWICAALWLNTDLTITEKVLIASIDSLSGKGHACFAGNDYLAKHLFVSPAHMREMLAELTEIGYIVRLSFTGRETLRCAHPDVSSDPSGSKQLMKEFKIAENSYRIKPKAQSRYRIKPRAAIGSTHEQLSPSSETDKSKENKDTTTTSPRNGNGSPQPVVLVSSFASDENDELRDIIAKLTEEFALNEKQGIEIEAHPVGYILEKAAIVRSKPRDNLAGAFMKALRDDWKAPKASEPAAKQKKAKPEKEPFKEQTLEEWEKSRQLAKAMKDQLTPEK